MRTRPRTTRRRMVGLAMVAAAVVAAGCSSDSTSSPTTSPETSSAPETSAASSSPASSTAPTPGEFSIAAALHEIPRSVADEATSGGGSGIEVFVGDLDVASDLGGLERPPGGTTGADAVLQWLLPLTGQTGDDKASMVAALVPTVAHVENIQRIDEIRAEVGWTIADVHSFVELETPPHIFTVLTGDFAADALEKALGTPSNGIWSLGGEDGSVDVSGVSAARPLGESLRLSLQDDRLAISRATPPVEAWRALDGDPATATLADRDDLSAVATALDAVGVYSAQLASEDSGSTPASATAGASAGLGAFTAIGIGQALDGDTPLAVFAYAYADDGAADAAVAPLTALLRDGSSDRGGRPWSGAFSIRDISAHGQVLTATLELKDFRPSAVWNILLARDNLTTPG